MDGQAGDDNVSAGPDDPAATFTDKLAAATATTRSTGDGGDDKLYGDEIINSDCDEEPTRRPTRAATTCDALIGGAGNDKLHGGAERDQLDGRQGQRH